MASGMTSFDMSPSSPLYGPKEGTLWRFVSFLDRIPEEPESGGIGRVRNRSENDLPSGFHIHSGFRFSPASREKALRDASETFFREGSTPTPLRVQSAWVQVYPECSTFGISNVSAVHGFKKFSVPRLFNVTDPPRTRCCWLQLESGTNLSECVLLAPTL